VIEGEELVAGTAQLLHAPNLVAAAKTAYGAEVVRPRTLMLNLNLPMEQGRPHWDLPTYRGVGEGAPFWFRAVVHNSQLFMPYAVPEATGLTWFYRGEGGGFEYWPDGPEAPSAKMIPPIWNEALVLDNDFTFHRPLGIGPKAERMAPGQIDGDMKLRRAADGRWEMFTPDDGSVFRAYPEDQLRMLVIWKAHCFKTETEAAVYDEHTCDLTLDEVWDAFGAALRRLGAPSDIPADPLRSKELRDRLFQWFPPPGTRFFADARRVDGQRPPDMM
jgi:hypothetical protein